MTRNAVELSEEHMRVYIGAGPETFDDEEPKHLDHLATRADGTELPKRRMRWLKR